MERRKEMSGEKGGEESNIGGKEKERRGGEGRGKEGRGEKGE